MTTKVPGITTKVVQGDKSKGKEVNTSFDNASQASTAGSPNRRGSTEAELNKSMNQSGSTEGELTKSLGAATTGGNKV